MSVESAKAIERIYDKAVSIPSAKPEDIVLVNGGVRGKKRKNAFYSLMTSTNDNYYGFSGRIKMWREVILPFYHQMRLQEMAREGGLEVRTSNHFFRSRIVITDRQNHYKLVIKSPRFASLMSHWFGNLVRAKLYKYHPRQEDTPSQN